VLSVPIVDISRPTATSLEALDAACRDHGFFLLSGHGLDELINRTWQQTARFFETDRSIKNEITRDIDNPMGYYDRELTKRKRDNKEVFDFLDPTIDQIDARNRWPRDLPGFRDTLVRATYPVFATPCLKPLTNSASLPIALSLSFILPFDYQKTRKKK